MAQSVELLLDAATEASVRHQWDLLADAGLPTERRSRALTAPGSEHHRPHLTLYAADAVSETAEAALPELVADLDLELQLGALLIFWPRRGRAVLVRQVTPSIDLLRLQSQIAEVCAADPLGQFGPGRWSPHVTLARRVPVEQLGDVVAALDRTVDRALTARVRSCRRWDGERKTAWLI